MGWAEQKRLFVHGAKLKNCPHAVHGAVRGWSRAATRPSAWSQAREPVLGNGFCSRPFCFRRAFGGLQGVHRRRTRMAKYTTEDARLSSFHSHRHPRQSDGTSKCLRPCSRELNGSRCFVPRCLGQVQHSTWMRGAKASDEVRGWSAHRRQRAPGRAFLCASLAGRHRVVVLQAKSEHLASGLATQTPAWPPQQLQLLWEQP